MAGLDPRSLPGLGRPDTSPPRREGPSPAEIALLVLALVWIVVAGVSIWRLPLDEGLRPLRLVLTLVTAVLPVAVIWVGLSAARSARTLRDESRRLQAAVDAMRQSYIGDRESRGAAAAIPGDVERKLAEIARATKQAEAVLTRFSAARGPAAAPPAGSAPPEQPRLALGEAAAEPGPPLARADLIRALNFPESETDARGFAALRRALSDRTARLLIQASQDVLTLLSQDGIYMDDLQPDPARPDLWRRFALGERGPRGGGAGRHPRP